MQLESPRVILICGLSHTHCFFEHTLTKMKENIRQTTLDLVN